MKNKSAIKSSLWAIAVVTVCVVIIILLKQCRGSDAPGTGKSVDSLYYKHITDSTKAAVLFGAKEDFAIIEQSYKDSIATLLNIKQKTIKEIVTITQEIDTDLPSVGKTVYVYDTLDNSTLILESMTGEFKNNYFQAQVGLGKDMFLKLKGVDTITGVWSEVKVKKKKYLEFTAMNSNPDINISGAKAFRSPEINPNKDWSIGMQLGYGVTLRGKEVLLAPYFGIGIQRNIISFNLKKKK